MRDVASVEDAMPLDELMETYDMLRDMAAGDAKEQFDMITDRYAAGFVDSDYDVLLFYDSGHDQGYLLDTHEIGLYPVEQSLPELFEALDDHADDVVESGIFDRLLDDADGAE